jgi:hypothetical protein
VRVCASTCLSSHPCTLAAVYPSHPVSSACDTQGRHAAAGTLLDPVCCLRSVSQLSTYCCALLFSNLSCLSTCRSANHQWMMGEALLVSPVLEEGQDSVTAHFTTGTW